MGKKISLGILGTGISIVAIISILTYIDNQFNTMIGYNYEGKILFEGNEGYLEFKRSLIDPDIEIVKLNIYSEPNTLVDFSINTSSPDFRFGDKSERRGLTSYLPLLVMVNCTLIVIVPLVYFL